MSIIYLNISIIYLKLSDNFRQKKTNMNRVGDGD